uniref:Vanin_C domain-containing protein n=1 Tax=Macrostomum lignano TaxID=282301 RepID=A0A1I8HMY7_9PLAT
MPFSNDTLTDFVEPMSLGSPPERFRVTRFPACIRIDVANGDLIMEANCTLSDWVCYRTVPMSVNSSLCDGSNCYSFWNFGQTQAQRSAALERCPGALVGLMELNELKSGSIYIPVDGVTGTFTYHTGIKKHPRASRIFLLNSNTSTSNPVQVEVKNPNEDFQQHCLQMRLNSTHSLGIFAVKCDESANATAL